MPQDSFSAPINRNDEVIDFSQSQQNSGGLKAGQSRPIVSNDYIDSDEVSGDVTEVQLAPVSNPSQLGAPYSAAKARPVLDENKNSKEYLDLNAVNQFNSASANVSGAGIQQSAQPASKLGRAKPLAKPVYKPAGEIAQSAQAPEIAQAPQTVQTAETVQVTTPATTDSIPIPAAPESVASAPAETIAAPASNLAVKTVDAPVRHSETETAKAVAKDVAKTDSISVPNLNEVKSDEDKIEKSPLVEKAEPASAGPKFIRPIQGEVIGKFGNEQDGTFSDGIKIKAAKGADVKAADAGEVVYSGNQLQGYGNMIIVRHSNGYLTSYAHLESLDLKKGAKIGQGEVLGRVGDTGNVSEPQLHFGVREGREPVDPLKFLK
jgi:murein DD-endopeptidase MepM/ murein hydrolase activator NlpD